MHFIKLTRLPSFAILNAMRYYLRLLAIPLLFLLLFGSLFVIWEIIDLPSDEELVGIVQGWFDSYGLPAVLLGSFIEGILLVGNYFPGAFIIFLGVILASSIPQAVAVIAVVTVGLFIAHIFNYALGRYGWYRLLVRFGLKGSVEQAREKLVKKGPIAILLSYWLPNLGALTDTAAGIIHMPFKKFLIFSLMSVTLWDIIFGTIVYSFKDFALLVITPGSSAMPTLFIFIAIWIIVVLIIDFYKRRKSSENSYGT